MSVITASTDTKLITGEELFAMGDIGPSELIDGKIVRVSPTSKQHGSVESRLDRALGGFVEEHRIGRVYVGEVGIYTRHNPDRVRGADLAFFSNAKIVADPSQGFWQVPPELVVEIISPTDRWQDIRQKIEEYFSIGVLWVWVIEPDNRDILVYHSATEMRKLIEGESLVGEGILEGFTLPVAELFAE